LGSKIKIPKFWLAVTLFGMSDSLVINEVYLSLQGESTFAGLPCIFVRLTACNLRCSYCDTAYAFKEGNKKSLMEVRAEVLRLAGRYYSEAGGAPAAFPAPHEPGSAERPPLPIPLPLGGGEGDPTAGAGVHGFNAPTVCWEDSHHETGSDKGSPPHEPPGEKQRTPHPWKLPLVELTGGEPLLQKNSLPLMAALCDDGFTVLLETSGALDIAPVDPRVSRIMDLKCPSSGEAARNRWENLPHLKATDEIKFVIGTWEDYEWAREQIARHKLAALCPLLFSWVHPLAPEQQDASLKKVPAGQRPISRLELAEKIIADALPVRFQVQLHKIIWPPQQRSV
jgi:organic radical activating enzyme